MGARLAVDEIVHHLQNGLVLMSVKILVEFPRLKSMRSIGSKALHDQI